MELKDSGARLEIELAAVMDLPSSAELRDLLLDTLARDTAQEVVVKAAGVERLGTACVQVLLAAARDFKAHARRIEMEAPSEAVTEAFGRLGLASNLQTLI